MRGFGAHAPRVSLIGFAVTLVAAPFAAAADAPFAPDAPPAPVTWFQDVVGPALTFASPRVVLDVWQLVVAAGLLAVLVAAFATLRALGGSGTRAPVAFAALAVLAVHVLGILLESATFGWAPGEMAGFAAYFPTMFLEPLVLCAAGVLALRHRSPPKGVAWAWVVAPLAFVASQLVFFQFPGGSAPGLALPWMLATRARWRPQSVAPGPPEPLPRDADPSRAS